MKQTTYMCPVCQNDEKPLAKTSMSRHKCLICDRSFYNKELLGFEINRTDFVEYWRERRESLNPQMSYPLVDGIERNKDVDSQMDNMVKESLDNLFHEITMMRIFNKSHKKAEETGKRCFPEEAVIEEEQAVKSENAVLRDEQVVLRDEQVVLKSEIDKIFDIILGRS